MNTIKSKDATEVRELSDAELASVAGGFSAWVAKMWMELRNATPEQGDARGSGYPVTPAQQAELGIK